MNRFDDQVVLVTASTQGIGLAMVDRFVKEGATVHLCSRKQKNVDEALSFLKKKYPFGKVYGYAVNVGDK